LKIKLLANTNVHIITYSHNMDHTIELRDPAVQREYSKISEAVIHGFANSISNLCHVIANPLETVVYPLSSLVFDASVIASKNLESVPEFDMLHHIVKSSPNLYNDANDRMTNRFKAMSESVKGFKTANMHEKIKLLSEASGDIFVPGTFIKGIKHLNNYKKFGTFKPPDKFANCQTHDIVNPLPDVKLYSFDEIRKVVASKFVYVYTESQELLMATPAYSQGLTRGKFPDQWLSYSIKHPELAKLQKIYGGGEFTVERGQIVSINNKSGHYVPRGVDPVVIEKAFIDSGFVEAAGKYHEIPIDPRRPRYPRVTKGKIGLPIVPVTDLDKLGQKKEETKPTKITNVFEGSNGIPYSENSDMPYHGSVIDDQNIDDNDNDYIETFKCDQYFDIYDIDQDDIKQMVEHANLAYKEYRQDITNRVNMIKWANNIGEIAQIGSNISQFAIMAGGHRRTWQNINKVCNGFSGLATGIASIAAGKSMMMLASGWIGCAIGIGSILMGFLGNDEDDGLLQISRQIDEMRQAIMNALQVIHQTIIDGFRTIENLILGSIIPRLKEISMKIDRLEDITCGSFREIHTKDLIGLIDTIKNDLLGEAKLPTSDRNRVARELGTWLDCHSKSPIQTGSLRAGGSDSKSVNVLLNTSNPLDVFTFYLIELTSVTGIFFDTQNIPNIPTFIIGIETYISLLLKYPGNRHVLEKAKDSLILIDQTIDQIASSDTTNILQRQCSHYRFMVGRQLEKCRAAYTDAARTLESYLIAGPEHDKLIMLLDSYELRRLLLSYTEQLCQLPITQLESKHEILATKNCTFITKSLTYAQNMKDYDNMKRCLELGLSVNAWDGWGQAIHYTARWCTDQTNITKMFHLYFRCPEIQINNAMLYDRGDTYGAGIRPILYQLNCGLFESGILFCAQGHDINEWNVPYGSHNNGVFGTTDMGNIYRASDGTWGRCPHGQLTISTVQAMNKPTSKIYRVKLRAAYKYYKLVESGLKPDDSNISGDCLLLLTCVLGDLYPLTYSKLVVNLNDPIESYGMTYLMLAAYCGHPDVVKYLLDHGANRDMVTTTSTLKTAVDFAIFHSHQDIATMITNYVNVPAVPDNVNQDGLNHMNQVAKVSMFQSLIHRIDGVLAIPQKANSNKDQLDMFIRMFMMDIGKLNDSDSQAAMKYITLVQEEPDNDTICSHLDMLDLLYVVASRSQNFGYSLSPKIERFIRMMESQ